MLFLHLPHGNLLWVCAVRSGSQEPDMAAGHSQWTMPENSFICQGFLKPYIEELLERMNGFRPLAHSHPSSSQLYWLTHPLGWETGADTGVYRLCQLARDGGPRLTLAWAALPGLGSQGLEVKVCDPAFKTRRLFALCDLSNNLDTSGAPVLVLLTKQWQISLTADDSQGKWIYLSDFVVFP